MHPHKKRIVYQILALSAAIASVALVIFVFSANRMIDDLNMDPLFALSGSGFHYDGKRTFIVAPQTFGGDKITYEVTPAPNPMKRVIVYRGETKVGQFEGKVGSFIGFKDINHDGKEEVILDSLSRRNNRQIFIFNGQTFVSYNDLMQAHGVFRVISILNYSIEMLGLSIVLLMFAFGFLVESRKLKK